MKPIGSMAEFEKVAIEAIKSAGINLSADQYSLHVGIVKFMDDKPTFSLSFTDANGNDHNGNGSTPEIAIKSAINQHTSTDIKF